MSIREWIQTKTGYELAWPTVVLGTILVALVVTLVVAVSTSGAVFGLYNPSWDGTTDFRETVESDPDRELELIHETERYPVDETANETVAFIVAPEETYGPEQSDRLREFADAGGTIVILDNVETETNALLADLDVDARLDGRLVLDTQHYDRGPAMPIATPVENQTSENIDQLTLNHATAIEPGNATTTVATSEFAYLAETPDDELDEDADLTTYPVATTESVGDGQVVVVGDPSLAINAMFSEPDNDAFLTGLYAGNETVLFDLSHSGEVPPLIGLVGTIRDLSLLQVGLGLGSISAVAIATHPTLAGVRTRIWAIVVSALSREENSADPKQDVTSDADLAAALRQRYPEWDDQRIERVIAAFNRTRAKRDK